MGAQRLGEGERIVNFHPTCLPSTNVKDHTEHYFWYLTAPNLNSLMSQDPDLLTIYDIKSLICTSVFYAATAAAASTVCVCYDVMTIDATHE